MDKVICIGKNYARKPQEDISKKREDYPFFMKPPSTVLQWGVGSEPLKAPYLEKRGGLFHDCEVIYKISRGGYRIPLQDCWAMLSEVTLGLDMTLRDVFKDQQEKKFSWEPGKVFPGATLLGPWVKTNSFKNHMDTAFTFSVNGTHRQKAKPNEMFLKPDEILHHASHLFEICEGDLLMTGTPSGVQEILPNDCALLEWGEISYKVLWQVQ